VAAQPVARSVVVQGLERPAPSQVETAHDARDETGGPSGSQVARVVHEHRRRAPMGFDVVHVAAESLESHEVLHRLPDDAGDRHLAHHPEQDALGFPSEFHALAPGAEATRVGTSASLSRVCSSWSSRYRPPCRSNSEWLPRSTMTPRSITSIVSARRI